VATDDFNADGRLDLAVADDLNKNVSILLGNGDGTFKTALTYGAGNGPQAITTGDFDGDGSRISPSSMAVAPT